MDTSYAEEAGLKSATFAVHVPYAYGTLQVEQGTHRLVRISPFDNQGRRQTSFAGVEVLPVTESTDHVDIPESEIKVDVFRSSGPGGQSVNTTDSAVRMTHIPTGIVVSMQNEKSQIQNRAAALKVLQSRLLQVRKAEERAAMDALKGEGSSLGQPDALLRAAPVPDGEGPAHRPRGRQHHRRLRRRHRRLPRGRHPLEAHGRARRVVTGSSRAGRRAGRAGRRAGPTAPREPRATPGDRPCAVRPGSRRSIGRGGRRPPGARARRDPASQSLRTARHRPPTPRGPPQR
ncbi:hypothetical protein GCM10025868_12150 [Angustibacter aerolatus]|uniref:Prokaryotic-type class I peptide chain release factors domain-containing protein n=1 Tax=Angustibacter aerolatus TaxID=1162965 RepID=A0ABQ6JCR4_9ACTN|nr:hypothetical protein GCM10025868_12150 [Angustibacter aerolatus]